MTFKAAFLSIFILLLAIVACKVPVKEIAPHFNKDITRVVQVYAIHGQFKNVTITTSAKQTNFKKPLTNLDIKLYDGQIKHFTQPMLDSLAYTIALEVKKTITNYNQFDWVNILFLRSDNEPASDSTGTYIFVYRPTEIK